MRKFPLASAYLLGAFDGSPNNMDALLRNPKISMLIEELDTLINKRHPKWARSEIYWRGMDLKEMADDAFDDFTGKSDSEKIPKIKSIIGKLGHYERIVLLTMRIGHLIYEEENG